MKTRKSSKLMTLVVFMALEAPILNAFVVWTMLGPKSGSFLVVYKWIWMTTTTDKFLAEYKKVLGGSLLVLLLVSVVCLMVAHMAVMALSRSFDKEIEQGTSDSNESEALRVRSLAICSLLISIFGVICGLLELECLIAFLLGIGGATLGIVTLVRIRRRNAGFGEWKKAVAGISFGVIAICLTALWVVAFIFGIVPVALWPSPT